jgi:adenine phosphoribosyltransferase
MPFEDLIRTIPDYPRPGILFRDVTPLLADPNGLRQVVDTMAERYDGRDIDRVAGIESRGFIFGSALAYRLRVGFIPIRKQGKLPAATLGRDYALEYGAARMEMHVDAFAPGSRVLIVDDLIATGGTAEAAGMLVAEARGEVVEFCFVIDLPDLGGRARLAARGFASHALCAFEGG